MTKRAVTYARVSYDDSGTEGRNLASQLDMCRAHCAQRSYVIVAELAEDERGASGADFDLPQLTQLLEMAGRGQFDVLVVREIDRLSRDYVKAGIIRRDLKKCGVEVEYVLYDFPPGPAGDLARHMMEAIAEYQRQDAIIKTARGRRNSVKSGNVLVSGRPPYGYAVAEKDEQHPNRRLVESPAEAAIVRMVFDWYTRGEGAGPLTAAEITRRLMALRVPTPSEGKPLMGKIKRRGDCEWNRDTVIRILRNETYTGHWYYGKRARTGNPNPREHWLGLDVPRLVDDATWEATKRQMDLNRRNAERKVAEDYLLRHRVRCGCGSACQCDTSQGRSARYRYYTCRARRAPLRSKQTGCTLRAVRADDVEAEIWGWIHDLLKYPEKLREAVAAVEQATEADAAPTRRRLAAVNELLAENETEYERLIDLYTGGVFKKTKLLERKSHFEAAITRLESEKAQLEDRLKKQTIGAEKVRGVLAFAEDLGPNVDRATKSFEVRRGLMDDLQVDVLFVAGADGLPEVEATSVFGTKSFRAATNTIRGDTRDTNDGVTLVHRFTLADALFAKATKSNNAVVE